MDSSESQQPAKADRPTHPQGAVPANPDALTEPDTSMPPQPGTSLARFAPSLIMLAIGVAGAIGSLQLGFGSMAAPGAGYWPMIISIAMVLLAAASLVEDRLEADFEKPPLGQVLIGVVSLMLFIVGFTYAGLVLSTFVVLLVWLRFLAHESVRSTLAIAGAATTALWLIFDVLLGVPFPGGF